MLSYIWAQYTSIFLEDAAAGPLLQQDEQAQPSDVPSMFSCSLIPGRQICKLSTTVMY